MRTVRLYRRRVETNRRLADRSERLQQRDCHVLHRPDGLSDGSALLRAFRSIANTFAASSVRIAPI